MKVSNTLFASVLALGAALGAPAMALDLSGFRPAGDTAAAPVEAPVETAAAETPVAPVAVPVLGTPGLPAADEAVAEVAAEPAPVVETAEAAPPALPPALPVAEVTPPPLPELPAYYVGIDGAPVGPLDEAALRDLIAKGALTEASLVWTEGMGDWAKAAEVAEIKDLLEVAPTQVGAKKDEGKPMPVAAPEPVKVSAGAVLPGNWHIDGPMPVDGLGMADADLVVVFNPDGTYNSNGTITAVVPGLAPYPVEIVVSTVGYWALVENADGTAEVDIQATTYLSVPELGVPPQANSGFDSFVVQVVDGNTVIADGTEWVRI